MELWSALASARDSHFVPSRRRRVGVVRLHVLLSPLPSSLAWRRPRGFARVQGRGRTLAGAAHITPPGASQAGEVAPPAVRPAIEALRTIHLHPHGVSAEDLVAICAQVPEIP